MIYRRAVLSVSTALFGGNNFFGGLVGGYPQIIHSNDYDTLSAGYKASKKCNAYLIYDSHEIATGSILADKYSIVKEYIKINEKRIIKKAYKVICVSHAASNYLSKLYKIEKPVVITNCPNYYSMDSLHKNSNSFEVLYQGIMSEGRGYEEFVSSARYCDNGIKLVIRGYGEIKDNLINLSRNEGVYERIKFAEPVEIKDLISAASQSSVGVVLTRPICMNYKMTVSNKLFEYIQAEIPVILSNVPEHAYLNKKYKIGLLVDHVSPKEIAMAINMLYRNERLYFEIKENVRRAKRELSWETFEKKLLEIYSIK